MLSRFFLFLTLLGAAFLLVGCETTGSRHQASYQGSSGAFWKETGDSGEPYIEIRLRSQQARFYKGGKLVGQAPVSTGREGFETPTGNYTILKKEINHLSNLYGSFVNSEGRTVGYGRAKDIPPEGTHYEPAPMPYFLRLSNDGTGMHAGFLPGYPASHGCIRLPAKMAEKFYHAAPVGTRVTIVN